MLDPKSIIIGGVIGATSVVAGQYAREVHEFSKFKKAFGIKTKARTSRAYAKEMTEQIKEAYGL